ncbi:MAG: site-specific integrase [Planctomycetaceae bacterium]|nr:site-specific integrase [Planctomycetaceae bacterium]
MIPIFPEIRPYLDEVWEQAEDEAEYVITRYRERNSNLRTQLKRIIKKAGLKPWPKLFHNLRSTRETELAEQFPMHTVCSWIGNSQLIAAKHYLQVTEDHFQEALQNPVQQPRVGVRKWGKSSPEADQKPRKKQEAATKCSPLQNQNVGLTGIEPALPKERDPKCGTCVSAVVQMHPKFRQKESRTSLCFFRCPDESSRFPTALLRNCCASLSGDEIAWHRSRTSKRDRGSWGGAVRDVGPKKICGLPEN